MRQQCILINVDNNATSISLTISRKQSSMKLQGDRDDVEISFDAREYGITSETTFTYLGDHFFVNDVYSFISASKNKYYEDISLLQVNGKSIERKHNSSNYSQKAFNLIKVRAVETDKSRDNKEDHSRFQPPENQGQHKQTENKVENEDLVSIAKLLNDKYHIAMNTNDPAELLCESIKLGIQQLAEKQGTQQLAKEQTVLQPTPPQPKGQNLQTRLTEAYQLANTAENAETALGNNTKEIEKLNEEIEGCKRINDKLVQENNRLTEQITQLSTSSLDLRGELIAAISNIKNDIELGDYILGSDGKSCGDDFLTTQADYLIQDINKINASSTTELREQIKNILRNTLKNNDNFFSKLAINWAYSRLPFMIEPSNQGQYLKPQRINSIFGKANTILATYGFQLSIPSLFVETLSDGDYIDVTGNSISPLTGMCPLLSQHKEKVDRSQRADVITDIIYTGFSEDNTIIEKTKVIV